MIVGTDETMSFDKNFKKEQSFCLFVCHACFFIPDNGGQVSFGGNNWPLRGMKNTLWEGGIRAVAFVTSRFLDNKVKGTIYRGLLHVTDWVPTLLKGLNGASLTGLELDGHDAWSAIA